MVILKNKHCKYPNWEVYKKEITYMKIQWEMYQSLILRLGDNWAPKWPFKYTCIRSCVVYHVKLGDTHLKLLNNKPILPVKILKLKKILWLCGLVTQAYFLSSVKKI